MLSLRNVDVCYGMIRAVKSVSLHVEKNEIVSLLGANGAGKTTLLSAISGIKRPQQGEILLEGESIFAEGPDRIVRKGIAHVLEGRRIFKFMTVNDNLLLGSYHRFSFRLADKIQSEIEEIFHLFPVLADRRKQMAGTLSGGEQQMLAIGRALLSHPKVLLLDEPSMGIAPKVIKEIFRHIARLRSERGMTILLVEQNAKAALGISDRGYVLETGRLVLEGTAEELLANPDVQRAYLGIRTNTDVPFIPDIPSKNA